MGEAHPCMSSPTLVVVPWKTSEPSGFSEISLGSIPGITTACASSVGAAVNDPSWVIGAVKGWPCPAADDAVGGQLGLGYDETIAQPALVRVAP